MTEQVEYNQMQVVIKQYDMLTLIFYDAHSHNHITITICLLCSQENLYDMPTIIFYDANNDNHVTPKICLLRFQDNLHDMLSVRLLVRWIRSIDRTIWHLPFLQTLLLPDCTAYSALQLRHFTIRKIFVRP